MANLFLVALLILGNFSVCIKSSKVLFLLPIASKSHKNVFDPLIDALATRGHDVTVISPMKTSKVPSVLEIVPSTLKEIIGAQKNLFEMRQLGGLLSFMNLINVTMIAETCTKMYEMNEVRSIVEHETFDLIIINGALNQCSYGLISHFKCPHIILTSMPAPYSIASIVGNRFPLSFVPEPILPLSHNMTFLERVLNMGVAYGVPLLGRYFFNPRMQQVYQKYFPDAPSIPEIDSNVSMIFMNSHFSLTYPRPLLPTLVEVGGMQCRPGNPLPKDLDDFLSGAKDGFILFSFGSIIKIEDMPEVTRKAFINVFSKLKQRIIWKWETEEMPDLPPNVKLSKWLPQQDILAHKNIRLFITHGGLLSTQEAVYHGVPLIGIPFFADQDLNMGQAVKTGYCLTVEILDFSEEKFQIAVEKLLNEPRFKENAQTLSRVYRDQLETPLERAVFWAEYVIRHKGAQRMQSVAKDLNVIQYHSIDVLAFMFLVVFIVLWLIKYILWNVLVRRFICNMYIRNSCKTDAAKKFQ